MQVLSPGLINAITRRLRAGRGVRRRLPGEGRLHIDRPLPFLCAYRRPADRRDEGTSRLVVGEGSYLVADGSESQQAKLSELVESVAEALADEFDGVLLMEVWTGGSGQGDVVAGALAARPRLRVVMPRPQMGRAVVAALVRGLRQIRVMGRRAVVEVQRGGRPAPAGMPPLLTETATGRLGVLMLGLQVPPVFRDPDSGVVFPRVLSRLHRQLSHALQQASFRFAHLETSHRPQHYLRLGRRTVMRGTLEADAQLAAVAESFRLLLAVTPVNAEQARAEFRAGRYRRKPAFHYRLLNIDPDLLKRRLYAISLEQVEDPALGELLRDKRDELDRQITLLHDRNSWRFIHGSVQLYGEVSDDLMGTAREILEKLPPAGGGGNGVDGERWVDASTFVRRAREEMGRYRRMSPGMKCGVELREDVPGVMVSRGQLLVAQGLRLAERRVEPLIQHEVGTHVVTYCNAAAQPLQLLRVGLPGYDELQEGTAVLAEHLVGGLSAARLRLLAARVVAVRRRIERRSFVEVFEEMRDGCGLSPGVAFTTTMRVFRGGGFTKDAVYLRGLVGLLEYLAGGGEIEPLLLGKVSAASLPIVQELRWREILGSPPLRPAFLDAPGAADRLARVRAGAGVLDLVEPNGGDR